MKRRIPLLCLLAVSLCFLAACSGIDAVPGSSNGNLQVQMVQPPPAAIVAGATVGVAANVLYDTKNGGVTWSCAPADSCGTFTPATTAFGITTLYAAPASGPAGVLNIPVTITATSNTDNTQVASASTIV